MIIAFVFLSLPFTAELSQDLDLKCRIRWPIVVLFLIVNYYSFKREKIPRPTPRSCTVSARHDCAVSFACFHHTPIKAAFFYVTCKANV